MDDNVNYLTGSPSSKYERRRASALLHNIQNIRIVWGKKPIVCYVSPVWSMGRFMRFYVNGFLSIKGKGKPLYREKTVKRQDLISSFFYNCF